MEEEESEGIIYLSSMPEGVVANILSLTTPSDACRSSAVSGTFHAAAQSDILWNNFLPIDWESLVSRRKTSDLKFDPISSSKKEIFFSLCDCPLLIDDGNKVTFLIPLIFLIRNPSPTPPPVPIVGSEVLSFSGVLFEYLRQQNYFQSSLFIGEKLKLIDLVLSCLI